MLIKKPYEISIWKDAYYGPKLAVIGAHDMISPIKALDPKFELEMNGMITLTFDMVLSYIDEVTRERVQNPFIGMLQSETHIKLKYDGEWYPLSIKGINEKSSPYKVNYSCKFLPVNELSRTGYSLEFDAELGNNMGSKEELAERALVGTDWKVEKGDIILEKIEEPIYQVQLSSPVSATKITTGAVTTLPINTNMFLFYSDVSRLKQDNQSIQFLWMEEYKTDIHGLILSHDENYEASFDITKTAQEWVFKQGGVERFRLSTKAEVSQNYRAEKLIKNQAVKYDPIADKYVALYKDSSGKEYYGFQKTQYNSPTIVVNLATNGENFLGTNGWTSSIENGVTIDFVTKTGNANYEVESFLKAQVGPSRNLFNSGLRDHRTFLSEGLIKGETYIIRAKVKKKGSGNKLINWAKSGDNDLRVGFDNSAWYNLVAQLGTDWLTAEIQIDETISNLDIKDAATKIWFGAKTNQEIYIEEFQVYVKMLDLHNKIIHPDSIDIDSVTEVLYYYYDPNKPYTSEKDIVYEKKTINLDPNFMPIYRQDYEKVRSITISKSNRFNILQEIAEKMEAWVELKVHFDEYGIIIEDEEGNPKKTVRFIKQKGERRYAGFEYGIDLIDIQRNFNSDQITTKIIVAPNSNEFAEKGYCAIGHGKDNYAKENFLYNFQYYVLKGLIPGGELNNDLYGVGLGLGLLTKLHNSNLIIDPLIEKQNLLKTEITRLEADEGFYQSKADAANTQAATYKSYFINSTKQANFEKALEWFQEEVNSEHISAREYYARFREMEKQEIAAKAILASTTNKLNKERLEMDAITIELEELAKDKQEWVEEFERKYSNYIQEGSWISEDYYDPNLYYLDAEHTLRDSAYPEVRYTIQVMDLSILEDFKNKEFKLGDITTIEDVEFFGYIWKNGHKTPYREEVVVTKISYPLDEPERVTLSLQNYRTQFQDLFQRITATTQSLQFAQGGYEKAAGIIDDDGLIKYNVLQNSLIVNKDLVYSSLDDSIVIDNTGITLTDLENMRNAVRLTSKGIFYTSDGGLTWPLGINADGISASSLTSGVLYTDNVIISKNGLPTFRWDGDGITAYTFGTYGVDKSAFVRLDQYGLYGVQGNQDFKPTSLNTQDAVKEIWDNAMFSLTWDGFNLQTTGGGEGGGYIRITSDLDESAGILVAQNGVERVEIGHLGGGIYGLRLSNVAGDPVLSADSNGNLVIDNAIYIASDSENPIYLGQRDGYRKIDLAEGKEIPQSGYIKVNDTYVYTEDVGLDPSLKYYEKFTEVFNASNNFIIYADGRVDAKDGYFEGEVHATSGVFHGEVQANSGWFKGSVEALSGYIGSAEISKDGLSIRNGFFEILQEDAEGQETSLLRYDDQGLEISGETTFSGILLAPKGKIGGVTINQDSLNLVDENDNVVFEISADGLVANKGIIGGLTLTENSLSSENGNFFVNSDGDVIANSIVIGTSAQIADYLQLGENSFLYNSDVNGGKVLNAGALHLYDTGLARFGDITIDAKNSSIYTGSSWSLTPDQASFRNISASGSISSMVFEPATVRAVGGSMIFKESVKPLAANGSTIQLKKGDGLFFAKDHYVLLVYEDGAKEIGQVSAVSNENENYDTISLDREYGNNTNLVSITIFGATENGVGTNWIVGINSSNTRFQDFLEPNSLTFSEFSVEDTIKYTPKIVLGKLTAQMTGGVETHGLYAESAYLTGSLTTKSEDSYAGVNTLDGHRFNKLFEDPDVYEDNSRIVFWAGATEQFEAAVQDAAFQVTEAGTLYAQRGYFENSIISNATIRASVLETATISGTGEAPALRILSTKSSRGGIEFMEDEHSSTPTLRISDEGVFLFGDNTIIQQNGKTILDTDGSLVSHKFFVNEGNFALGVIQGKNNRIEIKHKDAAQVVYVGENEFVSQTGISHFYKDVKFGNYIGEVNFERTESGYDVYVK